MSLRGPCLRLFCGLFVLSAGIAVTFPTAPRAADTPIQQVLPFNRPRISDLRASPRKAFALWHQWQVSVDNLDPIGDWYQRNELSPLGHDGAYYAVGGRMRQRPLPRPIRMEPDGVWQVRDMEDEVRRAAAVGLDGFLLSVCTIGAGSCWEDLLHMLQAANNVDPGFKVIPKLDMPSYVVSNPSVTEIADALTPIATDPALLKTEDGRLVVGATFPHMKPPSWYHSLRQAFAERGISIYLLLVLGSYEDEVADYEPVADALSSWGSSTPYRSKVTPDRVSALHQNGKIYVAPVRPQSHRPRNLAYAEARGSATYVTAMSAAIESDADWLLIITWNDSTEGAEMRPSTAIQWSYYDLTAYYLTWFKMRHPPVISRDVLYYFHRIHKTTTPPDPTKQPVMFDAWFADQQAPTDEIELLAFLRSPGTLRITTSAQTVSTAAPAGITSLRAPLANGYPRFALIRSGVTRINMRSAFNVRDRIDWQDLLYRGGSSTRGVVPMVANPPEVP